MGNNQINVSSLCDPAVQNILSTHRRSCDLDLFLCAKAGGYRRNVLSCFHVHASKNVDRLERHQGKVQEQSEIWKTL